MPVKIQLKHHTSRGCNAWTDWDEVWVVLF